MLRPTVGNCCADLDSWIDAVERHDKKGTWSNLYMLHSSSNAFMSKCTVFNGKTWGSLNHLKSAWRPKFPRLAASCLDQRIAMDVSDKTNPCRSYKDLAGDLASFMSSMPFMIPICCCNFSADTRKFAFLSTSLTLWEHLAAHPPWYLSVQREEACSCAVTFALSHDCQLHWLQKQPAPLLSLHFMAFCVCACLSALSPETSDCYVLESATVVLQGQHATWCQCWWCRWCWWFWWFWRRQRRPVMLMLLLMVLMLVMVMVVWDQDACRLRLDDLPSSKKGMGSESVHVLHYKLLISGIAMPRIFSHYSSDSWFP